MEEEVASAREHTNIELEFQKESLAHELDKYKASLTSELKSLQVDIDKLKQEKQELTSRIERLKNEERQEQYVQRPPAQPQLVYQQLPQQPVLQETPNPSEEEQ
jgi:peptidoglycan hydrolase CwlO-like protein